MTIDEKVAAYRMWLEGATLEQVGAAYGLSRQRMFQIFREPLDGTRSRSGRNDVEMVVYPAVREWIKNADMTLNEFCQAAAQVSSVRARTLRDHLVGNKKPRMPSINAVVKYTGLHMEDAFHEFILNAGIDKYKGGMR